MWSDEARKAAADARKGSGGDTSPVKQYFAKQREQFGSFQDKRGAGEMPTRGVASNQAAAEALMAGVRYGAVPVHDSMGGAASSPTTAPSPQNRGPGDGVEKGQRDAYTRGQMANSQLISNMRFNNFGKR
jgi:hypothetical protein